MIKVLLCEIDSRGGRGAIVPISRIGDLRQDVEKLKNGDYHTGYTDWMIGSIEQFIPAGLDFEPRSLIAIAAPSPKITLSFTYRGKEVDCLLPPVYADYNVKERETSQYINDFLKPYGFRAFDLMEATDDCFPQKLLAVHCGLGKYGRNNICYHEEFGSYIRLLAYASDLPCDEAEWFPVRRMESCKVCHACVEACPTNSIDLNHLIINADTCLTAINEYGGAFPDRLDKSVHSCLVGCMKCQDCCPKNKQNNSVKGISFTEEETMELLEHREDETYTDALAAKIQAAGIMRYAEILPRNLAVLLYNLDEK